MPETPARHTAVSQKEGGAGAKAPRGSVRPPELAPGPSSGPDQGVLAGGEVPGASLSI